MDAFLVFKMATLLDGKGRFGDNVFKIRLGIHVGMTRNVDNGEKYLGVLFSNFTLTYYFSSFDPEDEKSLKFTLGRNSEFCFPETLKSLNSINPYFKGYQRRFSLQGKGNIRAIRTAQKDRLLFSLSYPA